MTRKPRTDPYFAPTAPIHILQGLKRDGVLGRNHLLLVHDVLAHPQEYEELFAGNQRTEFGTIILDNGVIELDSAQSLEMMVTATRACEANIVILPDVLLDGDATYRSIRTALPLWREGFKDEPVEFMYVPQGRTMQEFIACAEMLHKLRGVGWWGIPKNLTSRVGSRCDAILACQIIDLYMPVHLLGFSDDFFDDITCARMAGVQGIDSAVPLRIVNQGVELSLMMQVPKRGDWWATAQYAPAMAENIKRVEEWLRV